MRLDEISEGINRNGLVVCVIKQKKTVLDETSTLCHLYKQNHKRERLNF